jgi:predicted ATPase/signal transduction histidine kinase
MIQTPGYETTEKLYESERTLIVRAVESASRRKIVLKILKEEYPGPRETAAFKREFDIGLKVTAENVIVFYALKKVNNRLMIVMEDFPGLSLEKILADKNISLIHTLELAMGVAEALGRIHLKNIIHKDVTPANILWDPQTGQLKIIDFGLSSELPKETQEIRHPAMLDGSLSYMSPEQTGRMNRSTDHRSDLYALGVILYRMTTRVLPFQAATPMALVHCHIAKAPLPPSDRNPEIPDVLSGIIMKLLSKNAEERYQSAEGLKWDLLTCITRLKTVGTLSFFDIGRKDAPDRFRFPQKLYGRKEELRTLLEIFDHVCGGDAASVTVSGAPGIGKSAIVHELQQTVVSHHGFFIWGKWDQLEQTIPYRALIHAFRRLIGQILTENDTQAALWKEKLEDALGPHGSMIVALIPELSMLIDGGEAAESFSEESATRFQVVLQNFIALFAKKAHPLVLFLDDLQWADAASLKLIEALMDNHALGSFLLILSYRDNEVPPGHPVALTLEAIQKRGGSVWSIPVRPLSLPDLKRLVADTVLAETDEAAPLAEAIYRITLGNPFFTHQLLQSLADKGVIFFQAAQGKWAWDIDRIHQENLPSDVIDLVSDRISRLPGKTIDILKLAACIGNMFELGMLSIVCQKPPVETGAALWPAMQEGLILPVGEDYKLLQEMEDVSQEEAYKLWAKVSYRFLHDRVHQAAYLLIPENLKKRTHLTIGRLLAKELELSARGDKMFDIVSQLNTAIDLIHDGKERLSLSEMNLQAGKRAISANAYESAMNHLKTALLLLPVTCWEDLYDHTLAIHREAANAAFLSGDFARMESIVETGIMKAGHVYDTVPFYETRIRASFSRNRPAEGLKQSLEILMKLGYGFPARPTRLHILFAMGQVQWMMRGKEIGDLYRAPDMADKKVENVCRILPNMGNAIYRSHPRLFPLNVLLGVKLFLKHGNAAETSLFVAAYGMILISVMGKTDIGFRFGELAFALKERPIARRFKARTWYLIEGFTRHWKRPVRNSLSAFLEIFRLGLASGDLEFGTGAAHLYCVYSYLSGKPLERLFAETTEYSRTIAFHKQETNLNYNEILRQSLSNLIHPSKDPLSFAGDIYNEEKKIPLHHEANDQTALYVLYFHKVTLSCLFEAFDQAVAHAEILARYQESGTGLFLVPVGLYYEAVARLACLTDRRSRNSRRHLNRVRHIVEKMKKWAVFAPMNHHHRLLLIQAEMARVMGEDSRALDLYDQAIDHARENGFVQDQFFSTERFAAFFTSRNKPEIASFYLKKAAMGYRSWGALQKWVAIQKTYPHLVRLEEGRSPEAAEGALLPGMRGTLTEMLDIDAVLKASQSISSEIALKPMLENIMRIMMESAGAQRGILFLQTKEELAIEAYGAPDHIQVTPSFHVTPLNGEAALLFPATIVRLTARSRTPVLLDQAFRDSRFSMDPYVIENELKSVLCMPVIRHGELTGVLYLENNLAAFAFTNNRVELLKLLTSQAAISIENARLYATLEENVEARTRELSRAQNRIVRLEKESTEIQMAGGFAHEMRNALAGTQKLLGKAFDSQNGRSVSLCYRNTGFLTRLYQVLERRLGPEPLRETALMIEKINENEATLDEILWRFRDRMKRALSIVDEIMEYSRLGRSRPGKETIFLGGIIERLIQDELKEELEEEGIMITLAIQAKRALKGDERHFRSMIKNIILNARDAIIPLHDPDRKRIFISLTDQADSQTLTVQDCGVGIDDEAQKKMFDPFFTTKPHSGKGLGLGVVSKLSGLYNGSIQVKSTLGQGTTFTLVFPFRP